MRTWGGALRAIALLSVGALVLHQLRFILGYGANAGDALALQGHSYLPFAEALVIVVFGGASLGFLRSLVRARHGAPVDSGGPTFERLWIYAGSALLSVYTIQEGIEGEVFAGHPTGLIGIFGHGGWTAILLAVAIGALIALLLEGAQRVIALISGRARQPLPRLQSAGWPRLPIGFPKLRVLSQGIGVRGPPALAS
jgi:hypothetical protein